MVSYKSSCQWRNKRGSSFSTQGLGIQFIFLFILPLFSQYLVFFFLNLSYSSLFLSSSSFISLPFSSYFSPSSSCFLFSSSWSILVYKLSIAFEHFPFSSSSLFLCFFVAFLMDSSCSLRRYSLSSSSLSLYLSKLFFPLVPNMFGNSMTEWVLVYISSHIQKSSAYGQLKLHEWQWCSTIFLK